MERPRHRVSAKIALLNRTGDKVLLTQLHDGGYGLPGGHVEYNETPDETVRRELREELGIIYDGRLERVDFWRDPRSERILLGYVGELDEKAPISVQPDEMADYCWVTLADFKSGKVATITYEPFIYRVMGENS